MSLQEYFDAPPLGCLFRDAQQKNEAARQDQIAQRFAQESARATALAGQALEDLYDKVDRAVTRVQAGERVESCINVMSAPFLVNEETARHFDGLAAIRAYCKKSDIALETRFESISGNVNHTSVVIKVDLSKPFAEKPVVPKLRPARGIIDNTE